MGLKGYRLWVMGQLDSTCRAPSLLESARFGDPTLELYKSENLDIPKLLFQMGQLVPLLRPGGQRVPARVRQPPAVGRCTLNQVDP
jgi:hypothetical protein